MLTGTRNGEQASLLSLLPFFFLAGLHCSPRFASTVFIFGRFQKFAAFPTLKAGSRKNSILRMG